MHSITELQKIISKVFNPASFAHEPSELYDPITYTLDRAENPAPVARILGCDLFGGNIQKVIPAALAIELFHNFTLLHDDIMDRAPLRRGKETVYRRWNTSIAILSETPCLPCLRVSLPVRS